MAALRYATRKLFLQRTQPLVVSPVVERRLVTRFISTSQPSSSPVPVSQSSGTSKILKIQEELLKKKQELYNLLAEVERERHYMNTSRVAIERFRNLKLLQNLSVQVDPKPSDPKWRLYRNTHIANGFLICGASIIFIYELSHKLGEGMMIVEDLKGKMVSLGSQVREGKFNSD